MKNKPENLEKEEIDCVALWKAVVLQSILDSCTPIKNTDKINDIHEREKFNNKIQANTFLETKDFELICSFANLDPDYIKKNKEKIYCQAVKKKRR